MLADAYCADHLAPFPMPFNPEIHHRRSIRLQEWDYSSPGAYFVTICTYHRECLFGEVADSEMRLSELGQIVNDEWSRTPEVRPYVDLDLFVVMPNHVHVLFWIVDHLTDASDRRGVSLYAPTDELPRSFRSPSKSVGAIVRGYKGAATKQINTLRSTSDARVWQRSFHDHIVRTESDLNRIRRYVAENPRKWHLDSDNPDNW